MQAVILAAGKGTRLAPLTSRRSKAMMPVLGVPIVERIMEALHVNGIDDFILVVGSDDSDITQHFEHESGFRSQVRLVAQRRPLGMADALDHAAQLIDGDFVLSACDNLVGPSETGRMIDRWSASVDLNGLLAVMPLDAEDVKRSSLVELEGEDVIRIVEKPSGGDARPGIASLPLYIFSPAILRYLPEVSASIRGERELQDAVQMVIDRQRGVRAFSIAERMTLTSPPDLLAINMSYLKRQYPLTKETAFEGEPNVKLVAPLLVDKGVEIGRDCVIGPNVYVENGSSIGDGVSIRDSVLLRSAVVGDGETIAGRVVF